eukprot:g2459.t1
MQATQQQLSLLQEEGRRGGWEVEESMGRNCQGELPVDRRLPERLLELGKANKARRDGRRLPAALLRMHPKIAWLNKGGVFVRSLVAAKEVTVPILLPRSLLMFDASERLLALQLAEQRRCDDSFWAPWIKILPSEEVLRDYHVAYASPKLLQLCEALPVIQRLRGWQDRLQVGIDHPPDSGLSAPTLLLLHAYGRSLARPEDMMNTSLTPNMEVYDRQK